MENDKFFLNDRFSDIYNVLISEKKVKNKSDLCDKLGINNSTVSEILSKRQGVTVDFIQKFCNYFKEYTPNDFFNPSKHNNSYENKIQVSVIDEPKSEYKPNCKLCIEKDKIIESKEDTIIALKETVTQLKNNIDLLKK